MANYINIILTFHTPELIEKRTILSLSINHFCIITKFNHLRISLEHQDDKMTQSLIVICFFLWGRGWGTGEGHQHSPLQGFLVCISQCRVWSISNHLANLHIKVVRHVIIAVLSTSNPKKVHDYFQLILIPLYFQHV